MAQWIKGLASLHGDLSLNPRTYIKSQARPCACNSSLRAGAAGESLGLAGYQPSSRISENVRVESLTHSSVPHPLHTHTTKTPS